MSLFPSSLNSNSAPTLLVVDNDPVFCEFEARTLRDRGYEVLKAAGAVEALSLARARAIGALHLLLTDFSMPGVDGVELTHQVRALHPETPVLMLMDNSL